MNTCDTAATDTAWVIKVLDSCHTYEQFKIARKVVQVWEKKHKFYKFKVDTSIRVYHNRITEALDDVENALLWRK
jgi:hypothetical protein